MLLFNAMMTNKATFLLVLLVFLFAGCTNSIIDDQQKDSAEPFSVDMPAPSEEISGVSLTEGQYAYVGAGNEFAFNLLRGLYKESGRSMVFSPLSIQYALGMAVNGAKGETAQEIFDVLGMGEDLVSMNDYCRTLLNQLPATDLGVVLKMADAMVLNDKYSVLPSYKERINSVFYAPVASLSFEDPDKVKALVNDWCKQNTEGLIPSLLDSVDPSTVCYLMNALYFKGAWSLPFDEDKVKTPFVSLGGKEERFDFLTKTVALDYADMGYYRIASVPYGRKQNFVFYVILPKEEKDFEKVLGQIGSAEWSAALKAMRNDTMLYFSIPEFTIDSNYDLKKVLQGLKVNIAFIDGRADFSAIVQDQNMYINDVIHKAKISLDKTGTEGAAATITTMIGISDNEGGSPVTPVEFVADHSFVYVIAERSSGAILFAGVFDGPVS